MSHRHRDYPVDLTERTTRELVRFAEHHAEQLRQRAQLAPRDPLDPRCF
jgi:hypothetical protein